MNKCNTTSASASALARSDSDVDIVNNVLWPMVFKGFEKTFMCEISPGSPGYKAQRNQVIRWVAFKHVNNKEADYKSTIYVYYISGVFEVEEWDSTTGYSDWIEFNVSDPDFVKKLVACVLNCYDKSRNRFIDLL